MILMSHVSGKDWLVHDGNSGGGKTREHVRSISGLCDRRSARFAFGRALALATSLENTKQRARSRGLFFMFRHHQILPPPGGAKKLAYVTPDRHLKVAGARARRRARQISPRPSGVAALRAGTREARGRLSRTGRRDVRLRPRRPVVGPIAGPARCAGLGGGGADACGQGAAEGAGVVR